tara:strand:- start:25867 stop:26592 length:726 start_codon:yes stop_codon:yes gene_type:complete
MKLPTIETPIFSLTLPSTKEEIQFRPFLVKEQKILMMAVESGNPKEIMTALKKVCGHCAITKIELNELPSFDLEYYFLNLRAKSIGEEIELNLSHQNGSTCEHVTNKKLNLLDVKIIENKEHKDNFLIDKERNLGVKMKYPQIDSNILDDIEKKSEIEIATEAVINCVDYIYDKDQMYKGKDYSKEDLLEFFENLTQDQFQGVASFFDTMPKLKHVVKWKCPKCGKEDELVLEGIGNFFAF